MQLVTLDFESFWSQDHSLSKMLPMTYVMHPETEIISCSVKISDGKTEVYFGEDAVRSALNQIDWSDSFVLAHNMSGFDAMILAWRFGVKPKMWGCTLAMARPIHSITVGNSLKKLVEHYSLGVKDNAALMNTKGRHLCDFTDQEIKDMAKYNKDDTDQCYALFQKLKPHFTSKELWHIDATIRMLVEPAFVVDTDLLQRTLVAERDRKYQAVIELAELLGLDIEGDTSKVEEEVTTQLLSAAKFSEVLTTRGVDVPTKPSPSNPEKRIPALAKTDNEFLALQENDDPIVAAAANARLAVKSTILETRIGKFLEVAQAANGLLPIPINYCGAETTGRDSGWAYNPQNLPRILVGSPKLSDAMRNCMKAPPGYKVIVSDLSGIELRVNLFLWKVPYAMKLFQDSPDKADLYKTLASEVLSVPYAEVQKMQRQAGKAMHLGCGFGLGSAEKFIAVAKQMAQIKVTEDEAAKYIRGYREKHPEIVQGWKTCHSSLLDIYNGGVVPIDPWGLCTTNMHGIQLPSGRLIRYPKLHVESSINGREEWWYGEGRNRARIYAGKVTENIVQALARDVLKDYKLQFFQETGLRSALDVHDELVYVVPEDTAQEKLDLLQQIMRVPPKWWPELIVWSEGDVATTYGEAK
jgi:N6-adenosine-specific RNA methylase IME4